MVNRMRLKGRFAFLTMVTLGLVLRVSFLLLAGSQRPTFLSGGSDAPAYILLANNLLAHRGFTYAGQPTAFRPPGYPLFIAAAIVVFGGRYIIAIRWFQFFLGLLTAGICTKAARRLFNTDAASATFVFALFLPTLIFSTAQVLTECLGAFLTALFLLFLVLQLEEADVRSAIGLGLVAGLESLVRFNAAALPLFAGYAVFRTRGKPFALLRTMAVLLLPLLVLMPWFIRNELVFHGQVLYSTHGGVNAVLGVLSPEGRTQPGDTQKLEDALGWSFGELETNGAARLSLPSEVELNRHALRLTPSLWRKEGSNGILLLVQKFADLWFSADQLLDTRSLRPGERFIRAGGVLAYWVVLAFAVHGLLRLRRVRPDIASVLLVYTVGLTLLHFPLVMNTRLRIPLMEPLIAILAGGGFAHFVAWIRNNGARGVVNSQAPHPNELGSTV